MLNTWQEWVGTETGVVLLSAMALPVALLTVPLLALRRKRGTGRWRTALADVGMVYGTVPWVWVIMLPGAEPGTAGELSLVPFADIADLVAHGDKGQIIGNMLVFAALGCFAPLRFERLRSVWRVFVFAAACSATLEVLQFVLLLDRVSSVDDVLLNATGAALASVLSWFWWRPRKVSEERQLVAV
ncbi:VanZ family protein [Lentzea sp. CA-135723]|uniref:VanZ family protein n=1 Tax=Lentzea sp. CA-135723 TaxID=3239950 RepID=UPI003D8A2633